MNVYVIFWGSMKNERTIQGIYSTMEKAESAKKKLNGLDFPEIVEWEVDDDTYYHLVY